MFRSQLTLPVLVRDLRLLLFVWGTQKLYVALAFNAPHELFSTSSSESIGKDIDRMSFPCYYGQGYGTTSPLLYEERSEGIDAHQELRTDRRAVLGRTVSSRLSESSLLDS